MPAGAAEETPKIEFASFSQSDAIAKYNDFKIDLDGETLTPILMRDGKPPVNFYELSAGDYYFDGSSSIGDRLYTLRYFKPNSSGELYMEGYAQINDKTNQLFNIELYDRTSGTSFTFPLSEEQVLVNDPGSRKLFYYNFRIYNLNITHEYYMGFVCSKIPGDYEVNGYISHQWTNYLRP